MDDNKTWYENSQINFGLILSGKRSEQSYIIQDFHPPYDSMLEFIKGKDGWSREDLYGAQFAPSDLDAALHAVTSLNGSAEEVDWPSILRKSAETYRISDQLEKIGKSGKRGRLPDLNSIMNDMRSFSRNEGNGLRDARDVDWESSSGIIPSGWDAIDNTIGGMAESGPIIVCATTKTGKSFFTAKFAERFLNRYENKKVAIFPRELTDRRYLKRSFGMYPSLMKPYEEGRIFITSKICKTDAIIAEVDGLDDCGLVIIDGIDGLVNGQYDTSKFAGAWSGIIEMGVALDLPIMVTAQPNRQGKFASKNTFLDRFSIEWSGAAENGAEQLWMLQHIKYEVDFDDERFPVFNDAYYLISWLQREGWTKAQKGPGAIIFKDHKYDKDGNVRLWEGEVYKNTLFKEGAFRRVTKKKSKRAMEEE